MLVLSRKQTQQIIVGNDIKITVLKIRGNSVRLGIEAPRHIHVVRGELPERVESERVQSERVQSERGESECGESEPRESERREIEEVTVEFKSDELGNGDSTNGLRIFRQSNPSNQTHSNPSMSIADSIQGVKPGPVIEKSNRLRQIVDKVTKL